MRAAMMEAAKISIVLCVILAAISEAAPLPEAQVVDFLNNFEQQASVLSRESGLAEWNYDTDITKVNEDAAVVARERFSVCNCNV